MSVAPGSPDDFSRAIDKLRNNSPIVKEQFFGLIGETANGSNVLGPGSYRKGYRDALLSPSQRPKYAFNLLLIGQLTDGTWVFPPSYDEGLNTGLNDLRFAVLAEGESRLFQETAKLQKDSDELRKELGSALGRIKELTDALERSGKADSRGAA